MPILYSIIKMQSNKYILFTIVLSQFMCTSLWFASNGVMDEMVAHFGFDQKAIGHLTAAVQFGFITGTLCYAILTIADRYSPSKVFFVSAILGAIFNLAMQFEFNNTLSIICWRFLTGFFLAGIYPVGMKIAADYFEKGLGRSLGLLVGALVLGTAFPHLLKALGADFPWQAVIYSTSVLACLGGLSMLVFVPDGPYRKVGQKVDLSAFIRVFDNIALKEAAFGYFGHMWELYAFWTFIPVLLHFYFKNHFYSDSKLALLAFIVISIGSLGCIAAAYLAEKWDTSKTAYLALGTSLTCGLLSPIVLLYANTWIFTVYILIWGFSVIADSPMFSTLVGMNARPDQKATAFTIVNCTGFAISIASIQLLNYLQDSIPVQYLFCILAIGPILSLWHSITSRNTDNMAEAI